MEPIKTIEKNGKKVCIYQDECDEVMNPRDWDNLGKMFCFHRRYILGDKHDYNPSEFNGIEEVKNRIIRDHKPVVILPVYMMDHSGLSLSCDAETFQACDPQGWDWGILGFIFCDRKNALEAMDVKRITKRVLESIETNLRNEVETYNKFLNGEVYRYETVDEEGGCVDSCGGFYSMEECEGEALSVV